MIFTIKILITHETENNNKATDESKRYYVKVGEKISMTIMKMKFG